MDSIYGYTTNLKLIKSRYDADTWHDNEYDNLDTIDALLGSFLTASQFKGDWKLSTEYSVEDTFIADNKLWIVDQDFISPSSGTFADWYAEHTDYVQTWNGTTKAREWAVKMSGTVNEGDASDYSSKAYAISEDLIPEGSAKEWSLKAKVYYDDVSDMYDVLVANPNIALLADHLEEVEIAADNITSINTVANNTTNIDTVANNSSDISTVSGITASVTTVADNISSINTTSTHIGDITDAVTHLSDIQAAPGYAEEAKDWATKMDGMVDGDYSAKWYANNARTIVEEIGSSRHLGEIVKSLVPLYDTALHLLDGSLIEDTDLYHDFIEFIAGLSVSNPSLFLTEAAWQTQVTTYGTCGKFVWNSTNRTVRLPRMVGFEESTVTLSQVGDYTQAGIPNIQGTITIAGAHGSVFSADGAFYTEGTTTYGEWGNDGTAPAAVKMKASRSSAVYGRSNTVQPASIKELVYMVLSSRASEGGIMITATNSTGYKVGIGEKVFVSFDGTNYTLTNAVSASTSSDMWTGTALEEIANSATGNIKIQDSKLPKATVSFETTPANATVASTYTNRFNQQTETASTKSFDVPTNTTVTSVVSADGYGTETVISNVTTSDVAQTVTLSTTIPILAFTAMTSYSTNQGNKYYLTQSGAIDWAEKTLPANIIGDEGTAITLPFVYGNGKWISPCLTGNKYALSTDCETWTAYDSPVVGATRSSFGYFGDKFYCYDISGSSAYRDIYSSIDGITWTSAGTLQSNSSHEIIKYANDTFFIYNNGYFNFHYTKDFSTYSNGWVSSYSVYEFDVIWKFNKYFIVLRYGDYSRIYSADSSMNATSVTHNGYRLSKHLFTVDAGTAAVCIGPFGTDSAYCLYYTTDGTNWSTADFPSGVSEATGAVYYNGTLFVTYSDNGVTKTISTTDLGANWTEEASTIPVVAIGSVYAHGLASGLKTQGE